MLDENLESYDSWRPGRLLLKPDPDYLANRREKNRNAGLGMGLIAIVSLIGYLGFGALFPTVIDLSKLVISVLAMFLALVIYIFVVRSDQYIKYEFIDVIPFLAIGAAQFGVNFSFISAAPQFGTSIVNIIAFNAAVLISVGSIVMVGSFRSFLITLIIYSVAVGFVVIVAASNVWHLTQAAPFATMIAAALYVNFYAEIISRISYGRRKMLKEQATKITELLENVLPNGVADRLNKGEIVADSHPKVSVIFADIVDFTEMTKGRKLRNVVEILSGFFGAADGCAERLGIEKIKTIGDAYMAVAGSHGSSENCATDAIEFALNLIAEVEKFRIDQRLERLNLRIGIHTGSAIGAVIGQTRKTYDYWGDTVNIASRVQNRADPDVILVTEQTYEDAKHDFRFLPATIQQLKGVGDIKTYALAARA